MAGKSTKPKRPELGRHARGLWYKYYRGRYLYFYRIDDDPQGLFSKEKWQHDKGFIDLDQEPPHYDPLGEADSPGGQITVKDLCNHWIASKDADRQAGDLAESTFREYKETCEFLLGQTGKTLPAVLCGPTKFLKVKTALAKRYNANGRSKRVTQIRSIFNVAYEDRMLESPPNFGHGFKNASSKQKRELRNAKGKQMYEPGQVHALLAEAAANWRGMVFLGLQAGFGNEDCAALPRRVVDLENGWLDWGRVKNSIPRRVPLWPETVEAIRQAIEFGNSKGETELVFVPIKAKTFISPRRNGNLVAGIFRAARDRAQIDKARTFYDLRRTFQTVAEELKPIDLPAIDHLMGHVVYERDMRGRYRQDFSDERLVAVTNHVRSWLYDC